MTAERLDVSMKWRIRFAVEGRGPFPLDMLRYDACHPTRETELPTRGFGETEVGPRRIHLERFAESASWRPTIGRWNSFGWGVVLGKEEREL